MTRTVLLVDDSAETRQMYGLRLREEGYDVLEAADGESAIEVARQSRPDLIFMNMAIPAIDGWSAIALLKQTDGTAGIPIVALTGFDENAARVRADQVGADGFIGKPCKPSRLLDEVRRWLDPAETEEPRAPASLERPALESPRPSRDES